MKDVVFKVLPNGLTVCLIKKKGYVMKEAMFAVRCGSTNVRFRTDGQDYRVPHGTAHFVEHKLFEKKHGNVFDDFAELGASANAFTGLDTTAYYFTCSENFEKCLTILGKMCANPYFTHKNVEKEKGIICSEITMYKDNPGWQSYFGMLSGLFGKHPVGSPIAGDEGDIGEITEDTLRLFYDSYYRADNAIVIAAGDIDEDSFFEICQRDFALKDSSDTVTIMPECGDIDRVYVKSQMPLATPVFTIGYKEGNFDISPVFRALTSKVLMEIFAGSGSVLYEKLYANGLCTNPLGLDYLTGRGYGASIVSGMSPNPEGLLAQLQSEIENFVNYGISEKYLERIVVKCKGGLIQSMENLDFLCSFAADNFAKSIKTLDFYEKYDSIKSDDLMERLVNHFRGDNLCLSTVVPA